MKRILQVAAVFVILAAGAASWAVAVSETAERESATTAQGGVVRDMLSLDSLRITVVYDNYSHREGLKAAWGFSCLIEGAEKCILFDTGGEAPVLLSNMDSLSIEPGDIDIVLLSHKHGDHTGGMRALLDVNPGMTVYVPKSFSEGFKEEVRRAGAELVEVFDPVEVCRGVFSAGELGTDIKEQSLALNTDEGLIVITGCAHPGIVSIVNRAREVAHRDVLLAMGGFHLGRATVDEIEEVIDGFRRAGVSYAGPCHCSGDITRHLFREEYQENYISIGVGAVLEGATLE